MEAVDLQPLSREAAPKMLRMLELGMRKAGAGAAGLADSPLARGPDDRETRFGTRSEWADFADFAQEREPTAAPGPSYLRAPRCRGGFTPSGRLVS